MMAWQLLWLLLVGIELEQPIDALMAWWLVVAGTVVRYYPFTLDATAPSLPSTSPEEVSETTEFKTVNLHLETRNSPSHGTDTLTSYPMSFPTSYRYNRRASFASLSTDIRWQQELANMSDDNVSDSNNDRVSPFPADPTRDKIVKMKARYCFLRWSRHLIYFWVVWGLHCIGLFCIWYQLVGRWSYWSWAAITAWSGHGLYIGWVLQDPHDGGQLQWGILLYLAQMLLFWLS
jgi:hypothetical protein